ncbi:hypothetical protein MNV49_006316 [Pseudohyphozyma bogoriensis]|nr:hypothetical protein MNV49_006316 [Pseudohyphozyma bogoriensis]
MASTPSSSLPPYRKRWKDRLFELVPFVADRRRSDYLPVDNPGQETSREARRPPLVWIGVAAMLLLVVLVGAALAGGDAGTAELGGTALEDAASAMQLIDLASHPPYVDDQPPPLPIPKHRCNASAFLLAIQTGVALPSDLPNSHLLDPSTSLTNPIPPTNFSFELGGGCVPPRVFSTDEACALLEGFGPIAVVGDSFMRHIWSALLILLSGTLAGATNDYVAPLANTTVCSGENMFDDRDKYCRKHVVFDLKKAKRRPCGGRVDAVYLPRLPYKHLQKWLHRLPQSPSTPAPVLIQVTLGANHYDGVHLTSYQYYANMEKVQLLLNYLSLVREEGGDDRG